MRRERATRPHPPPKGPWSSSRRAGSRPPAAGTQRPAGAGQARSRRACAPTQNRRAAKQLRAVAAGPESSVGATLRNNPALVVTGATVSPARCAVLQHEPAYPLETIDCLMQEAEVDHDEGHVHARGRPRRSSRAPARTRGPNAALRPRAAAHTLPDARRTGNRHRAAPKYTGWRWPNRGEYDDASPFTSVGWVGPSFAAAARHCSPRAGSVTSSHFITAAYSLNRSHDTSDPHPLSRPCLPHADDKSPPARKKCCTP